MEYKRTNITQRKETNLNQVGKNALQLKDNRQLKAKTTQLMGLDEEDEFPMQMQQKSDSTVTQLNKYKKTTKDYVQEYEEGLDDSYDEDYDEDYDDYYDMTGDDVYNEWDPTTPWESAISVATPDQAWDYTVTLQWDVFGWKLRAHVHYYSNLDGTYRKARGNGWVSGINDFQFPTPQSVVDNAPADPTTV